jgi:hypothetical protein
MHVMKGTNSKFTFKALIRVHIEGASEKRLKLRGSLRISKGLH